MRITLHAECQCPECKARINAATPASEGVRSVPREGDLTLCFKCGAALQYFAVENVYEHLSEKLREPPTRTPQEFADEIIARDHAALRVRRLTREEWHDLPLETRTDLTTHRRQLTLYHLLMTDWRYQ